MYALLVAFFLPAVGLFPTGRSVVQHSASPGGKYDVAALGSAQGDLFLVETASGQPASGEIASDFEMKSIAEQCQFTSVHWRRDSAYVAITADHDRHHVDFILLKRDHDRFVEVPFDWETTWNAALPPFAGFGYPKFISWLPQNRAKIQITRWDGRSRNQYSVDFDVNLSNTSQVVSLKKLPAEALY